MTTLEVAAQNSIAEISIKPISQGMFESLQSNPLWQEALFSNGYGIERHQHLDGNKMYVTRGVQAVVGEGGTQEVNLPAYAAVIVPRGVEHGWVGVQEGYTIATVGHMHPDHGLHNIVAASKIYGPNQN